MGLHSTQMHFCTSFTLIQIMSNFVEFLFVYIFWEITTENFRYSSQKQSKYFLFFPKDKKHSKTFPPLFRSNYVGSWCNLNSPFLQSIRVDLKKVSDKMPWLITDLIFFLRFRMKWIRSTQRTKSPENGPSSHQTFPFVGRFHSPSRATRSTDRAAIQIYYVEVRKEAMDIFRFPLLIRSISQSLKITKNVSFECDEIFWMIC